MLCIRNLFSCYLIICFYGTYCSSFDVTQLTLDEIDSMFGEEGCIEGLFVSTPHTNGLPQSYATLQSNTFSQVINKEEEKWKEPMTPQSGVNGIYTTNNTFSSINVSINLMNSNGKSPMSLLNELAMFNKIQHHYQLTNEEGPPHKKLFSVTLELGDEEYSADGPSIKKAQHSAANIALQQTHYKHPPIKSSHKKGQSESHCGFNGDQNTDSKSPISLVHEIAMSRNLPVSFEIESEEGPPHMRTYITKCTVGDKMTTGEGNGKKLSKKIAAERMLEELKSLISPSSTNLGSCTKQRKRKASKGKKRFRNLIKSIQKVLFRGSGAMSFRGSDAHHFKPEIRMSDDDAAVVHEQKTQTKVSGVNGFKNQDNLFKSGKSHTDNPLTSIKNSKPLSNLKPSLSQDQAKKPKDHLKFMAQLHDFQVYFTDFKKGNQSEILTLVSLTTDPPQVCIGSGSTTEASHSQAALTALKMLSKIGLDSLTTIETNIKKEIEAESLRIHLAELSVKKSGGISFKK